MAERLPIYEIEQELVARLRTQRRLIISAPTGSGKSTQVPQMLLDHGLLGNGQVVVLQPRRLATRMLAARVASERKAELGREVGYQIRLENVTSDATRIRFVTEGVLLRQMLNDRTLRGVSALVFDEFHERHLYGDITLAQALDLQETARPDLLIIVMSATLDAEALVNYMGGAQAAGAPTPYPSQEGSASKGVGDTISAAASEQRSRVPLLGGVRGGFGCSVLASEGRTFPVDIQYADAPSYADKRPVWEQAADAFIRFVQSGGQGDVLIFMPGGFEISQTMQTIRNCDESRGWVLLPLHGELPPREQDAAVARYEQRKVVVATNVAETSLTIDGVRCVIDSGLARMSRYDSQRGINTLLVEKISRASSDQRAGRAGRTAPGVCLRLWSPDEHAHRAAQELPEVKRLDLSEVVLTLKASGVEDLRKFRWLEPPDEQALAHAEELLTDLGALSTEHGTRDTPHALITPIGRKMLAFPLHPRYARMLLAAQDFGCVQQACLVAALTQGRDLLLRNVDRDTTNYREDLLGDRAASDFFILMRAWNYAAKNEFRIEACRRMGIHMVTAKQVGPLFQQFLDIARREKLDVSPREVPDEALQKCLLIGFSDRVGRRLDSGTLRCELVHGRRGVLARESTVQKAQLFVVAEIREVGGRDGEVNTILSQATAIEEKWLHEFYPDDMQRDLHTQYDATQKRVVAAELIKFRGLALSAKRVEPPPADAAARLLTDEVMAGRLSLTEWDESVDQWIQRLTLLAQHCPELQLTPITAEDKRSIVEQVCLGATGYKDIKEKPVKPVVQSWLSHAQRELVDKHAPERLNLPNGKTPKVTYEPGRAPFVSMRIQELYDIMQTPKIAMGRVPVVVHILTPGFKPVQVTQDLGGFWREHYPKLKSELQRRYPKHEWR
jgi:ATP-dependent helicase HrpB